jgi:hypothetical protein
MGLHPSHQWQEVEVFEDEDNNKYPKHLMTIQHLQATKGAAEKLLLATKESGEKNKILKMHCKPGTEANCEAKELHVLDISKAESQVVEQKMVTKVAADAAYDLFCQFVHGEAQTQWDCIVKDICMKKTYGGLVFILCGTVFYGTVAKIIF